MNSTVNAERQLGKTGQWAGPSSGIGSVLVRKRGREREREWGGESYRGRISVVKGSRENKERLASCRHNEVRGFTGLLSLLHTSDLGQGCLYFKSFV